MKNKLLNLFSIILTAIMLVSVFSACTNKEIKNEEADKSEKPEKFGVTYPVEIKFIPTENTQNIDSVKVDFTISGSFSDEDLERIPWETFGEKWEWLKFRQAELAWVGEDFENTYCKKIDVATIPREDLIDADYRGQITVPKEVFMYEIVEHNDSPYRVAGISPEEKKYYLPVSCRGPGFDVEGDYFILAVKRGDKFLNLFSMEEFDYDPDANFMTMPSWKENFFKRGL